MNIPLPALPLSLQLPDRYTKRRVLLVDTSSHTRTLRAEVMRRMGIEVDCAADIGEARGWWKADLYDLVLVNMEKGPGHRDRFCEDVRGATPRQRLAFLIGSPQYLAFSPRGDESPSDHSFDEVLMSEVKAALSAHLKDVTHPWGILEASRRISAVRSACNARTTAMRDRPGPARDSDLRASKPTPPPPPTLDDLLREEMQ